MNIQKQATDPYQYDQSSIQWSDEIDLKSPHHDFHLHYLSRYKSLWNQAHVLDVWLWDRVAFSRIDPGVSGRF